MSEDIEKLPRGLKVFIWRKRTRGFLVVIAKSLEEARVAASEHDPKLRNFVIGNEPEAVERAAEGLVTLVKQR